MLTDTHNHTLSPGATWVQDISGGTQYWTGMALADDGITGVAITYDGDIYG